LQNSVNSSGPQCPLEDGTMTKDQDIDFEKRADECALHAATAHNDRAREVWAKMEQYWRRRAAGAEAPLVPAHPAMSNSERVR